LIGFVAVFAMLGWSTTALAEERSGKAARRRTARVTVPLRFSGTVSEAPVPDAACRGLRNTPAGSVSGEPLGDAKWQSEHCVDVTEEPGVLVIRDGELTLTSALGTVTATYRGHGSLPSTAGHIYVAGDFTITGGSGRFQGATGGGLLKVVADPIPGVAAVDFAGVISMIGERCCDRTRRHTDRD
jgi:hypothetical protein